MVYFGEPLTPSLQSIKLETFFQKYYLVTSGLSMCLREHGYHGALFSTNDRGVHGEVLDAVRSLKMQAKIHMMVRSNP